MKLLILVLLMIFVCASSRSITGTRQHNQNKLPLGDDLGIGGQGLAQRLEQFEQFVPAEIVRFYKSLTPDETLSLMMIGMKFQLDPTKKPQTQEEAYEILRREAPTVFEKTKALDRELTAKFQQLSKPTQAYLKNVQVRLIGIGDQLENQAVKNKKEFTRSSTALMKEVFKWLDDHPESKVEIEEQWPEIGRFFRSNIYRRVKEALDRGIDF